LTSEGFVSKRHPTPRIQELGRMKGLTLNSPSYPPVDGWASSVLGEGVSRCAAVSPFWELESIRGPLRH
jgi:hypothetical protein